MPSDVPNSRCLRLTTRTTFASPGSQSETDTGQRNEGKETAKDGTVWNIVPVGSNAGCLQSHSILRERSGPTSRAKRKTQSEKLLSAWELIFSASMMRHMKHCTEAEARRRTQDNSWTVVTEELGAFIAIMYAGGVYGAKNFPLKSLWSTVLGPQFFRHTTGPK
ncbi:uncharacterized protein LOC126284185 [Schistocerca gregaria]|uniref:uncharacterized protein LOC126284185 n=1 Tax=Schistocerca gregaria TaxID=7010 RepID=UPI00211F449D|nr:uncharacterized protein LOC126284185 [Schistocerca gregaria]